MPSPLHIISLGAGVQSSAMAMMASCGEITPMPDGAIFADTQDEPKSVYRWLEWLTPRLSFPVSLVTNGSLSARALEMRTTKDGRRFTKTDIPFFTRNADGSIGKVTNRACTKDFKLEPIKKQCAAMVGKPALLAWRRKWRVELKLWNAWKKASSAAETARKKNAFVPPVPPYPTSEWGGGCKPTRWSSNGSEFHLMKSVE